MTEIDGQSLLENRSSDPSMRVVWSETPALGSPRLGDQNPALRAIREDGWSLVLDPRTGANELSPPDDEPAGVESRLPSPSRVLRSIMTRFDELRWIPPRPPDPNPRLREKLEALGY